jgi:hypothetical protein
MAVQCCLVLLLKDCFTTKMVQGSNEVLLLLCVCYPSIHMSFLLSVWFFFWRTIQPNRTNCVLLIIGKWIFRFVKMEVNPLSREKWHKSKMFQRITTLRNAPVVFSMFILSIKHSQFQQQHKTKYAVYTFFKILNCFDSKYILFFYNLYLLYMFYSDLN